MGPRGMVEEGIFVHDREYPVPDQVLNHRCVLACSGGVKRLAGGGEVAGAEGDFGQDVPENPC